jgi:hypothetical protein
MAILIDKKPARRGGVERQSLESARNVPGVTKEQLEKIKAKY